MIISHNLSSILMHAFYSNIYLKKHILTLYFIGCHLLHSYLFPIFYSDLHASAIKINSTEQLVARFKLYYSFSSVQ